MTSLMHSLSHLKTEDIPWERLTTPYRKGKELPDLIRERRFGEIGQLVEYKGTSWQVTPWTLLEEAFSGEYGIGASETERVE